jgi:alpha-1,3-rhamnosyl/mannosyltransferase
VFQDFYDSPSGEKARNNFRKLVQHCQPDHYITVSNFIKNELEHLFPATKGKVSVTYSGINHLQVIDRKSSESPVFIYIGTIEERKNLLSLTTAFESVWEVYPKAKLILAGGKGLGADHILEEIGKCKAKKAVTYEGFITNERRAELLSLATGFVYPSLYEGFGLPILEAMLAGCPVITANTGACAEISHSMAWEVKVTNPDSIAKAMQSVIEQPSLASEKAAKAKIYSQEFTWQRCAKETVRVYEKVLNSK